eukprot:12174191-Alexandrium_andersonii.AAC.1
MSASLVGSEMCIRDSPSMYSGQPPPDASYAPPVLEEAPDTQPFGPREEAVSYTHLTLPTICSV